MPNQKIHDVSHFTVEIPIDMEDVKAGELRVEIAKEISEALVKVQLRFPDNILVFKYGCTTGTGMLEVPLV